MSSEASQKETEYCKKCGQEKYRTGEYPCDECGRPILWDSEEAA